MNWLTRLFSLPSASRTPSTEAAAKRAADHDPEQMGAFEEDALSLADAMEARDWDERP
jgi:hypothetical protein